MMATRTRANTRGVRKEKYVSRHTSASSIKRHYDILQELGRGSFGTVSLVRSKATGQEHVCKVVDTSKLIPEVYAMMKREIDLLSQLDHPRVVSLYEYAEDVGRGNLSMILEYIPGGSCAEFLTNSPTALSESVVGKVIYQLLVALRYCHARGVVHRDVKPENLMLAGTPDNDNFDCKLIDFGVATGMKREMRELVGTPAYMAPEVVRREAYIAKTDLWSAGVSAVELLTKQLLFGHPGESNDNQKVFDAICCFTGTGELEGFLETHLPSCQGIGKNVLSFLHLLLQVAPGSRLSAQEALGSLWMRQHAPPLRSLSRDILRSLDLYIEAPEVVRCCLFCIVARRGIVSDREREVLSAAFLAADRNGDGHVTKANLQAVLGDRPLWGLFGSSPSVDVDDLFEAANLGHSGGLSFTEFTAACIYARHESLADLAAEAFAALDDDRDGKVRVEDIEELFRERDLPFLNTLPQHVPFSLEEWSKCVHRFYEDEAPHHQQRVSFQDGLFNVFFSCRQHADSGGIEFEPQACN